MHGLTIPTDFETLIFALFIQIHIAKSPLVFLMIEFVDVIYKGFYKLFKCFFFCNFLIFEYVWFWICVVSCSSSIRVLKAIWSTCSITADMALEKVIKNHKQFDKSIFSFQATFRKCFLSSISSFDDEKQETSII